MRIFLFPVILASLLCGIIYWKYQEDIAAAEAQYSASLESEAKQQRLELEGPLRLLYHELRTVANLPKIRSLSRDVNSFDVNTLHVVQQAFDVLDDNVGLASLYVITLGAGSGDGNGITSSLIINPEFHLNPNYSDFYNEFSSIFEDGDSRRRVDSLVRTRLKLLESQLGNIAENVPRLNKARGEEYPAASFIQYLNPAQRLSGPGWLIYLVPIYTGDGKVGGGVVGVIPLAELRQRLTNDGNFIVPPNAEDAFVRFDNGLWQDSHAWIKQRVENPSLIFSTTLTIDLPDINGEWSLWSGRYDENFFQREDVTSPREFAYISIISSIGLALGLSIILTQSRRQQVLVETKNAELEQRVDARTHELKKSMDASEQYALALSQSEERHRAVFDNAADGIIMLNPQGIIEAINPAALNMFAYAGAELVGENISALMPEPYKSAHDGYMQRYRETGNTNIVGSGPREAEGQRHDGTAFPIEIAIARMDIPEQTLFVGIVRDITARKSAEDALRLRDEKLKEAEQQLLQSEKMASVGQLAAGVAHEINNPIGYVNSNLGSLEQYIDGMLKVLEAYEKVDASLAADSELFKEISQAKQDVELAYIKEDVPELLSESQEGIIRVRKIVQDLKEFSHVDEAEWQMADLHQGIESTLNIVHNEIKYSATLIKCFGELPKVECIPSQINQVIMNLLVNASHAMEAKGEITITTGRDGDHVWIEIRDTGKGIPPESLGRIFEPFYTTKDVGVGTGLGLSLSYGIVQKHHGDIQVESKVGKGTSFRVVLPVTQSHE